VRTKLTQYHIMIFI